MGSRIVGQMRTFRKILQEVGLEDLGMSGGVFTWYNIREGVHVLAFS